MQQLKVFTIRLPAKAVEELKEIAQMRYIPTRTMLRAWIMQRLETECLNRVPAAGGELPGTAPDSGAHRTHGAGADD